MSITENMKEKGISFQYILENIAHSDKTVIGVLRKKIPDFLIENIVNYIGARFTFYASEYGSNYYKSKIKAILSWFEWRQKNKLFLIYPCQNEIKQLKKQGKKELDNEKISSIIYGF
jgi:hypothetical protein